MHVVHLKKAQFDGSVQLNGLCCSPSGMLFASGYIGPSPDLGRVLQLDGSRKRLGNGLTRSTALAYDTTTETIIVSANDGTTPNRPSAPNGIFRIALDGSISVVTRDVTGSGGIPIACDPEGNIYRPGIVPETTGWSILRHRPTGETECIATGLQQVVGIGADGDRNLFVADAEFRSDEGVLLLVTANGTIKVLACEDGLRPHAIAVGKERCVFFSSIRGENSDISEIFKWDSAGNLTLVARGLVQVGGLAYDSSKDVLYALNFLNSRLCQSTIPKEYHNDTLLIAIDGENESVPEPFFQPASEIRWLTQHHIQSSQAIAAELTPELNTTTWSSQCDCSGRFENGPGGLARIVIDYKRWFDGTGLIPSLLLSEEAIERLITLAFHASCMEEEGRFPRFRILAGAIWDSSHRVHFGPFPKRVNNAHELRKLAPAAAFRGSAIVIDDNWKNGAHDALIWRGIYDCENLISTNPDYTNSIDSPAPLKGPVLVIRVEGPGYLKASFLPGPIFSLRGGTISELFPLSSVSCVEQLFTEAGEWLNTYLPIGDKRVQEFFTNPSALARVIGRLWSRMLWHVSDRRRGGTFLIIPKRKGHALHPNDFDISIGHNARLSYGKALIDNVLACLNRAPSSGPGYGQLFQLMWEKSRAERERSSRMLADLANVDGCVVLDRRFSVLGFGGKIKLPVIPIEGFGARHGSAKAWCTHHPGGLAFVVSQDGDVRVISSGTSRMPDAVDVGHSILESC